MLWNVFPCQKQKNSILKIVFALKHTWLAKECFMLFVFPESWLVPKFNEIVAK